MVAKPNAMHSAKRIARIGAGALLRGDSFSYAEA